MNMPSNDKKQFSAEDIERYHSGKLSAAEMHALEKAALDDPFLADALEGYTFTSTAEKDLAVLQSRLEVKKKKRPVLLLFNNPLFRIAAIFVLLAGITWIVYRAGNNDGNKKSIAGNGITQALKKARDEDSTPVATAPVTPPELQNKDHASSAPPKMQSPRTKNKIPASAKRRIHDAETGKSEITAYSNMLKNDSVQNNAGSYQNATSFSFMKTDSDAVALHKNDTSQFDKKLRFSTGNDTVKNLNITMKPLPNAAEPETVVIGSGIKRKSSLKPIHIIDSIEPSGGWSNYDEYIASNIQSPEEMHIKPVSGEVQLSFDVNKEGNPVNITVVKSLCDKCDDEAIRLLKQGPKWKKKKKGKGKVSIHF